MADSPVILEIIFQLVNGQKLHFQTYHKRRAQEIIDSINPQKFFLDKHIRLFSASSMTSILSNSVSWMVFKTPLKLNWAFPLHFDGAQVITKEQFIDAAKMELPVIMEKLRSGQAGQEVSFFLELITKGASCWFLRVYSETLMPAEKIQIPKMLQEISGFHAHGADGGGILINMRNVMSWTVFPGPIEPAAKAWKMSPSSASTSTEQAEKQPEKTK